MTLPTGALTQPTAAHVRERLPARELTFGRPALFCPDGSVSARLLQIVQAQRLVPIYRDSTLRSRV
jgi:hypothetical protein